MSRRRASAPPLLRSARAAGLLLCLTLVAACATPPVGAPAEPKPISEPGPDAVVEDHSEAVREQELFLIGLVRDPVEPLNRVSYRATKLLRVVALDPLARGYAWVLTERARESVDALATNLRFPVRFVNDLLQLRPRTAGIELARFLTNSTLGIAGLFDPAAHFGLSAPEAEDLGQTLGHWGVGPGFFLFLPVLGPSSARDAVGLAGDMALNPASWFFRGAGTFLEFNRFSLAVESLRDLEAQEADPYDALRDLWAVGRERAVRNFAIPEEDLGDQPVPSLYAVMLFRTQALDPETRSVELVNGAHLDYAFWPGRTQRLVFLLPGLGGFRVSGLVRTLANRLVDAGYSVVSVSNPFHRDFLERASSSALPGFTPDDAADVRAVLVRIAQDLRQSAEAEPYAVVGASLGGLYSLFLAAEDGSSEPALPFERFVAINPPVDMLYALRQLDDHYAAALEWPDASRREHIERALLKAAMLQEQELGSDSVLPFDRTESRFLIGTVFRRSLRDAIFSGRQRSDPALLHRTWTSLNRGPAYREISAFSFEEYMRRFILPLEAGASDAASPSERIEQAGARWLGERLRDQPRLRVFTNADDFLLRDSDRDWLRATLGDRLQVFPSGGHLGNLVEPRVLDAIVRALETLPPN